MRIVLDLQACQSDSRFRGIGRYTLSLAHAMVAELLDRDHKIIIALSRAFPDEAAQVRTSFEDRFSGLEYFEFSILEPSAAKKEGNDWRQMASRLQRERGIANLEPDMVHVSTLMADGWEDDAVASVGLLGVHIPTALTHYDLIPLVMSDIYMPGESRFKSYYYEKLKNVRRADLLLAISNYSRAEAILCLEKEDDAVVNISSAVNDDFSGTVSNQRSAECTLYKYSIPRDFLLYAPGGFDPRKNLDGLLEAYSMLSFDVRSQYKLVISSKLPEGLREGLVWKAQTFGIGSDELIITDYIPDNELADLYRLCRAYVFPSLHEGFGLPVLEAMSFGAVVIASNCTSIPEAHGFEGALFNPKDPSDMAAKILAALTDEVFRARLQAHASIQVAKFSWEKSAKTAVDAMESLYCKLNSSGWRPISSTALPSEAMMLDILSSLKLDASPDLTDLERFHACYKSNTRRM
ncbi:glycosyltransferase involved in cell wall biosynthesis [Polynucleobacter sphagniphilus]|uniref:glycosyltransferase family 4 protein n=1 Tax=Polynucleobacter sphagniphilus TaxID=1743169 RepID=UPI0024756424|nr:glycosyltransferase family 1 protein [Polynucleobacter sphagniphilus]MDH6420908.1 glycosyltransferase involved in cell wall biosynthesis [Polynucleobacter sphagniphilus]